MLVPLIHPITNCFPDLIDCGHFFLTQGFHLTQSLLKYEFPMVAFGFVGNTWFCSFQRGFRTLLRSSLSVSFTTARVSEVKSFRGQVRSLTSGWSGYLHSGHLCKSNTAYITYNISPLPLSLVRSQVVPPSNEIGNAKG